MPYLQSFSGPEHGVNPYFPSFEVKKRLLSLKKSILLEKPGKRGNYLSFLNFRKTWNIDLKMFWGILS